MRQHTRFLIAHVNLFGAAPFSHRSAGARASQGGRRGSRQFLLPIQTHSKGGNCLEITTNSNSTFDT
jgi:hypothetical protein